MSKSFSAEQDRLSERRVGLFCWRRRSAACRALPRPVGAALEVLDSLRGPAAVLEAGDRIRAHRERVPLALDVETGEVAAEDHVFELEERAVLRERLLLEDVEARSAEVFST